MSFSTQDTTFLRRVCTIRLPGEQVGKEPIVCLFPYLYSHVAAATFLQCNICLSGEGEAIINLLRGRFVTNLAGISNPRRDRLIVSVVRFCWRSPDTIKRSLRRVGKGRIMQIDTLFGGVELRLCCMRRIIGKEVYIGIVSATRVSGYGKFGM